MSGGGNESDRNLQIRTGTQQVININSIQLEMKVNGTVSNGAEVSSSHKMMATESDRKSNPMRS